MNFAVWISFAITSSSSSTAEVWRRRSRAVRRGQTSTMIFFPWFLASQGLSWFASGLYRVIVLVLPTILRDLGRKSPKSLRTEYVSAFMVTCLGLIIAISLGYFTREDVLAVQIQEIRWATTFFGLGYATIGGNRRRQPLPSWGIIPFAFDRRHWLDFISNRSTPYAQQMMLAASTATSKIMRSAEYRALVLLSRPYWIMVDCNGLRTPYDYQFMWAMQYTHPSPLVLRKVRWELTWSKSLVLVKISTMFGLHAVAHRWSANNHLKAQYPFISIVNSRKEIADPHVFLPFVHPHRDQHRYPRGTLNGRGWKSRNRKQNTTSLLDLLFEPLSHRGLHVFRRHQILQNATIVVKAQLVPKCRVPPDDVVQGLLCYIPIE